MVIKDIWRLKRCKVEQRNTNYADKIFCVQESAAVYIQTFSKLLISSVTNFCARILDVCLFQVVMSHCCGKMAQADICQCRGDFNTLSWKSHETFFVLFSFKDTSFKKGCQALFNFASVSKLWPLLQKRTSA